MVAIGGCCGELNIGGKMDLEEVLSGEVLSLEGSHVGDGPWEVLFAEEELLSGLLADKSIESLAEVICVASKDPEIKA